MKFHSFLLSAMLCWYFNDSSRFELKSRLQFHEASIENKWVFALLSGLNFENNTLIFIHVLLTLKRELWKKIFFSWNTPELFLKSMRNYGPHLYVTISQFFFDFLKNALLPEVSRSFCELSFFSWKWQNYSWKLSGTIELICMR